MGALTMTRAAAGRALALLCVEPAVLTHKSAAGTEIGDVRVFREMTSPMGGANKLEYEGTVGATYTVWLPRDVVVDVDDVLTFTSAPTTLQVLEVLPLGTGDPKRRVVAKVRG